MAHNAEATMIAEQIDTEAIDTEAIDTEAIDTEAIENEVIDLKTIVNTQGVAAIENSELRKIAEQVLNAAKYAFVAVAANPEQVVRPDSLEATYQEMLGQLPSSKRLKIQTQAQELANVPPVAKEALFGVVGLQETRSFLAQGFAAVSAEHGAYSIDKKLLGLTPNGAAVGNEQAAAVERLEAVWGPSYTLDPGTVRGQNANGAAEAATNTLAFYIREVRCVDETNPEWFGSDEFALAGVIVDETGDTDKIGEVKVGDGFDDGDRKSYNPAWRYATFNLNEGPYWPKAYSVTLLAAEKDHGGLSDALAKAWSYIGDAVKKAVEDAVRSAASGLVGPAVATAIGKITAWAVGKFVEWLIGTFKDDLFPPAALNVTIPSLESRWTIDGTWGSRRSPLARANFYGHGGHYQVAYYWRIEA
jgi:hypothetical protein